MWFIFPQLDGLGGEAHADIAYRMSGPRLIEISKAVLTTTPGSAESVLGAVDTMKLRSCASLFADAAYCPAVFQRIFDVFYAGKACSLTLAEIRLQT